jgi:hypothetical protein
MEAATCHSVDCLKKWLLPELARREAAALAAATEDNENDV